MNFKATFILAFFSYTYSFSQMTVKSSTYIYSTNIPLFIEDNLNLEQTSSKLYLRDDSQLVQGAGTTGNSGIGQLSVYQNGNTNEWAYNYWCSPTGNTDSNDTSNRDFRGNNQVYDIVTVTNSNPATFTSALNGSSSPLSIAKRWIHSYNPGNEYSQWDYKGDAGEIPAGYGFSMKGTSGSGNNQRYDFRGKPNSGTLAVSVAAELWTLSGNPYPSALDSRKFIHDPQNKAAITGVLYMWDQDLSVNSHYVYDYVGGYAAYTINAVSIPPIETFIPATFNTYDEDGVLNTVGPSSTSGKTIKRYIPIAQGFIIEGKVGSTGTAYLKNEHRHFYKKPDSLGKLFRTNTNNNNNKQKNLTVATYTKSGLQILPKNYKRLRLNIDFNDVYTRQLVQTFNENATKGFDYGLEIERVGGPKSDAYWPFNGKKYLAQAYKFEEELKIPLLLRLKKEQAVRIRLFDVQNFDTAQKIYVYDSKLNTYHDLTYNDFLITLEEGIYKNRFKITFAKKEEVRLDSINTYKFSITQNNTLKKLILFNPEQLKIKAITLFDISGKKVLENNTLKTTKKQSLNTNFLSNGSYLVTVKLENNSISKKIIVKN